MPVLQASLRLGTTIGARCARDGRHDRSGLPATVNDLSPALPGLMAARGGNTAVTRNFCSVTLTQKRQRYQRFNMAGGPGFEPRLKESETEGV